VIRPRLAWRLIFAFFAFPFFLSLVSLSFGGVFFTAPILGYTVLTWRRRIVLRGDELHESGTLTQQPVLRAADICAFTARPEISVDTDDANYVVLRLWTANYNDYRAFRRLWWGDWNELVRWVAFHHTKPGPDGIHRWTIATDETTMRRVARLIEAVSPPPYA